MASSRLRTAAFTAALVALVGSVAAPPAGADVGGVTTVVPGLGRATELDLVSRGPNGLVVVEPGTDLARTTAVAYGIGARAPSTVDLTRRGLPTRAAQRSGSGTSAVLSSKNGLVVAGEPGISATGTTVGHVHRRTGSPRLLPVRSPSGSAEPTVVESNLEAGGAVWSWTYRGVQYVNDYDYGRQIQSALWLETGGRIYNPTEAGDMYTGPGLDAELRHGSPVASAVTGNGTQSTRAIPLEWNPRSVSSSGGNWTPVLWQDARLGKDLTLDDLGMPGVARYRTVVTVPEAMRGHLEMPTAYLRGAFGTYYGVDAVAGTATPLEPAGYDPLAGAPDLPLDFVPASGRGGVIAATADGAHAMGIYGVTTTAGGQVSTFTVHDYVPDAAWQAVPGFGNGQGDFSTAKLRALYAGSFPAGTSSYEAFVITGTLDEVVARMGTLAGR